MYIQRSAPSLYKCRIRIPIICQGSVSCCLSIFPLLTVCQLSMRRYETHSRSPYSHPYPPRPPSSYSPSFSFSGYHRLAPPARLRPLPTRLDSGVDISSPPPSRRRNVLVHTHASERKETPRSSLLRLFVCRGTRSRSS
jgi:hypothetical protein